MKKKYTSPIYTNDKEIEDIVMISTQVDEDGNFIGIVDIEDILG